MSLSVTVELRLLVCSRCGCPYGVPMALSGYRCPACAERRANELQDSNEEMGVRLMQRDRTIAALRGALTKRKRRRL